MQNNSLKLKTFKFLIVVFSFSFFALHFAFAADDINQQILDLRKQLEELQKQSDEYRQVVLTKQKQGQTLKKDIDILNNQILRLETQIKITQNQINSAELTITDLRNKIFDKESSIQSKKNTVGLILNLIRYDDQENLLNILLKNNRLSDFVSQAKQDDNLNKNLLAAITVLKVQKDDLDQNKQDLEKQKQRLEQLNNTQKNKQVALDSTKEGKDNLLAKTKGQEAAYQQLLDETEKKKTAFFDELRNLESQALQTGAFIVHVAADSIPPKGKIFKWPEEDYVITQGYGYTKYARRGAYGGAPHNGVDLAGGYGTAIRPIANGAILASGFNNGFGNWVAVRHDGGLVSIYAHLRYASGLTNGTAVSTNDIIGYEGATGNATGSHLHLSLYRDFFTYINDKNGQLYFNYFEGSLNPLDYL